MAIIIPTVPGPTQKAPSTVKKVIDKQKKEIDTLESEAEKAIDRINKKLEETFKFVCALRLDMISDRLEGINPEWSRQLDMISDSIEKGQ
jgi:hypothetical protein